MAQPNELPKRKTKPGAVDDNAMQRVKDARARQKRMMDDAWNNGRNSADPDRKKRTQVQHDDDPGA